MSKKKLFINVICGFCHWFVKIDLPYETTDEKCKELGKAVQEEHFRRDHNLEMNFKLKHVKHERIKLS